MNGWFRREKAGRWAVAGRVADKPALEPGMVPARPVQNPQVLRASGRPSSLRRREDAQVSTGMATRHVRGTDTVQPCGASCRVSV